ncbi:matrilysin family metalloendoprotease [Nonomuraea zeae]|uniref:Matrilysin family metalloendoprotease n=2 Tax=Nonomuraea zeae TaxID=1642303 RepID=A0A5S4G2Y5_9ACTN|nr:matrilysin family metalloendoprotease [Nonomuraea zeae]
MNSGGDSSKGGFMMSESSPISPRIPTRTLKEGDQGPDVALLYQYLKRFGYFPNPEIRTGNLLHHPAVAFAPDDPTRYDDRQELAVRRFQQQQGLMVSGVLDDTTLSLISRPRCGFPDDAVAGVDMFVAQGNRWPGERVTYSFDNYSPDLDRAQQRAAVIEAFGKWSAVTPLTFTEVTAQGDIRVGWYSGDHGDGFAFSGPGGVLAHCFYPPPNGGAIAGDCHFDEAETWSVNLPPIGIDLCTVALHELGHGLGLAHSAVQSSVMYAYYGGPLRDLTGDDVAGIQSIYGARRSWFSLGGTVFNPAVNSNSDGRLEVFVRGLDSALHHKWQVTPNGGWSDYASEGGWVTGPIAVGRNAGGRLEVFVRGSDGALYHKWQTVPGGGWRDWSSLGGWVLNPVVATNADGRLEVFVTGSDGACYHNWQTVPNGGWSGWASLGGWVARPFATANADGRLEVFARGADNATQHIWQMTPGGSWSGWSSLGSTQLEGPVVGRNQDGRLEVFTKGEDGALWHTWQTAPSNGWA